MSYVSLIWVVVVDIRSYTSSHKTNDNIIGYLHNLLDTLDPQPSTHNPLDQQAARPLG